MKTEFNLSKRMVQGQINKGEVGKYIMEQDVKEFIRLLKEGIDCNPVMFAHMARDYGEDHTKGFRMAIIGFNGIIDNLVGDKLK